MSDYNKSTNFTTKDTLPSGNANKIIKGTEIDIELTAIASAIASKANSDSPTFTGSPLVPTATVGSNTTQIANTSYVKTAIDNATATLGTMSTQAASNVTITGGTITGATISGTSVTANSIANTGGWSVTPSGTTLYFAYNGVNKAKLDSNGNFTVAGDVTGFGTV